MVPESPCTPPMSPQLKADPAKAPKMPPADTPPKPAPVAEAVTAANSDASAEPAPLAVGKPHPDETALSDVSSDASGDLLTLEHLHVRIQTRPDPSFPDAPPVYERVALPGFQIALPPTLEGLRGSLLASRLGAPERDIFFPQWTRSLYVAWEPADGPAEVSEPETVECDAALAAALARAAAGETLVVLLQECRNARYSRARTRRIAAARPFHHHHPRAWIPVYAEKRTDGAVFYDPPLIALPFGFPPTHAGAGAAYGVDQFSFVGPYGLVPFVYHAQPQPHRVGQ